MIAMLPYPQYIAESLLFNDVGDGWTGDSTHGRQRNEKFSVPFIFLFFPPSSSQVLLWGNVVACILITIHPSYRHTGCAESGRKMPCPMGKQVEEEEEDEEGEEMFPTKGYESCGTK